MTDLPLADIMPSPLESAARQRLEMLADILIPGGEGFPKPSEIGIGGTWIQMALGMVPVMGPVVAEVLAIEGDPEIVINLLQAQEPRLFGPFSLIVAGAYFMHPKVRSLFGYPGQTPKPNPPLDGEWEYFLEGNLLEPVIQRGPIFRVTER